MGVYLGNGRVHGVNVVSVGSRIKGGKMTIREVINVLIDAPDLDKKFIVEGRKDALKDIDTEWGTLEIVRIVNCGYASVGEVKAEEERKNNAEK